MIRPKLGPRVEYGANLAGTTLKYGAVGLGVKVLYDITNSQIIPRTAARTVASLEENIADPIIENTGPVGKTVYTVDKWQGEFWSTLFGQTKEKQEERRQEYLNEETIDSKAQTGETTQAVISQPTTEYYQHYSSLNIGNGILVASLIIGALLGHYKGKRALKKAQKGD